MDNANLTEVEENGIYTATLSIVSQGNNFQQKFELTLERKGVKGWRERNKIKQQKGVAALYPRMDAVVNRSPVKQNSNG